MEEVVFKDLAKEIKDMLIKASKNEDFTLLTDFSEVSSMHTLKSFMHSIFYNLISNSIKYRQPDIAPVITIKSYKTEKAIKLVFSDNCKGIDLKKYGNDVFGLYKRFDFTIPGKGLGLFMVKTQVESLGGKITVQGEPGKGCEFTITFPSRP